MACLKSMSIFHCLITFDFSFHKYDLLCYFFAFCVIIMFFKSMILFSYAAEMAFHIYGLNMINQMLAMKLACA